jgi:hypothetical protein
MNWILSLARGRSRHLAPVAALVGAILCAAPVNARADEHLHRTLERGRRSIRNVLILPPQVSVFRLGMRGGNPQPSDTLRLEQELVRLVDRAVRERVWNTRITTMEPSEVPEERYAMAGIQSRYDRLAEVMHRQRKGVRQGRYSLTDAVLELGSTDPDTVLVFTRFSAVTLTPAAAALTLQGSSGLMFLAFADGATGEILFLSQRKIASGTSSGEILGHLRQSLRKIPAERFVGDVSAPTEWAVSHVHAIGFPCEGWLYVAEHTLGFRPLNNGDHGWRAPFEDVAEVADTIGYGFHVRLRNGRSYRFAGKGIERDQLLALIAASRK